MKIDTSLILFFNCRIFKSIADVPDPVDLAAVLIPARIVPEALRDWGEPGIRAAIIGSGGFHDVSPEGAALETDCLQIKINPLRMLPAREGAITVDVRLLLAGV